MKLYNMLQQVTSRLQNSRFFFLKISKEIGKAWRKSLVGAKRASLTGWVRREKKNVFLASLPSLALCFQPCPDLLFDCSRVLEYEKIRTVLQSR